MRASILALSAQQFTIRSFTKLLKAIKFDGHFVNLLNDSDAE